MDQSARHEQFLRLFTQAQPRVYGYLRTMVYRRADADDIFQNVACVLWQKFDEFKPGTRFDRWACAIAYHQVRAFYQKEQRNRIAFRNEVMDLIAEKAAAESHAFDEFRDSLQMCLEKLADEDRRLVRLRFEPDATGRSVAAALGRSETAVSRALNRIYGVLLQCIRRRTKAFDSGGLR